MQQLQVESANSVERQLEITSPSEFTAATSALSGSSAELLIGNSPSNRNLNATMMGTPKLRLLPAKPAFRHHHNIQALKDDIRHFASLNFLDVHRNFCLLAVPPVSHHVNLLAVGKARESTAA